MTRNLKALGLAFVAVFAMSAIAASGAHATEFFHSHKEKTIITADNLSAGHTAKHVFELIPGLAVECSTARFAGTEVGVKNVGGTKGTTFTTESLTVTPSYEGCTVSGKEAIVNATSGECHYKLFAATTETVAGEAHGNVEVLCTSAVNPKEITITVPALATVIHVGNQLVAHAIHYTNVNTGVGTETEEVTLHVTTPKNIAWSCTPKATCLTAFGVNSGTEAKYTGTATAKGFIDNNIAENAGKTGKYEEGVQTGIWKGPAE